MIKQYNSSRYQSNFFRHLLLFSVLFALVVIFLGAYTRLTDAGLGCPDWPGCYGKLIVPESEQMIDKEVFSRPLEKDKAWAEMIHRLAAGILGILVLIIAITVTFSKKVNGQGKSLPYVLLLLIIFQAALGMWTVTHLLSPIIVTAHLIGGFTTLSLIWWLYLNQKHTFTDYQRSTFMNKPGLLKPLVLIATLLVIAQIILGGWTSTNYAALACGIDFPKCTGEWIPKDMDFKKGFELSHIEGKDYEYGSLSASAMKAIQMTHRIGALMVTAFLLILIKNLLIKTNATRIKNYGKLIFLALIIQVSLGIFNVIWALPLWTAVFHNIVAAFLLMLLIATAHHIFQARMR